MKFPDSFTGVITTPGATVKVPIVVNGKPTPSITLQKTVDDSWTDVRSTRFKVNNTLISISSVREADAGEYRLVLSNKAGQSTTYEFSVLVESE